MNLEKQLKSFYSMLDYNPLSTNAISVYEIILIIDCLANWVDKVAIANTTIMSKTKLTVKQLQNARNELILKNYISYEKGRNQNEAPKYRVAKLYEDNIAKIGQAGRYADGQADGYADGQADGQADGYINYYTILDSYFNYIYNNSEIDIDNMTIDGIAFGNITERDRTQIITIMTRLGIYCDTISPYIPKERIFDLELQYWIIKELYFSSYRLYLHDLDRESFLLRFSKAKEYVDPNENIVYFLNYCIKSLQQYFCPEPKVLYSTNTKGGNIND